MIRELLSRVPLFSNLAAPDFAQICSMVETVDLAAGETLFEEGSEGDHAYIIQEGRLEIVKRSRSRDVLLAVRGSGEVIGEMALLEDAPRTATVRARTDTRLVAISKQQFDNLLDTSPSAARTLLNTVLARWRETESLLRQSEKMAQLGVLVAGIAHELNNPAAAVKTGAAHLKQALDDLEVARDRLDACSLDGKQRAGLMDTTRKLLMAPLPFSQLDALAMSDRESDLLDVLEARGVEDAWKLVPALAEMGLEATTLEELAGMFAPENLAPVLEWVVARHTAYSLLEEIGQGTAQISDIVQALKTYSYLDRAPVLNVDIHEGLDHTLLILRNKIKRGINVRREYADDLPLIEGYGSELNQVWTNIIHNAVDALDGQGEITLRTRRVEGGICVEIEDNGPGIPAEVQPRVFEPFFTTKPPGQGTGMGLDISYNIVTLKHGGEITFESEPGRTVFRVWLPESPLRAGEVFPR